MSSYSKKKLVSLAAPILSNLKVHKLFEPIYGGIGHILTFHRVIPKVSKQRIHNHLSLEISPSQLEATINFYKKENYDFVSLDQVYHFLKSDTPINKFVAFTFDDGYKDNFTEAYPILRKHNIPFTIYITTNFPDHKAILWWYLLEDSIIKNTHIDFEWKSKSYHFDCSDILKKEKAFDQIRTFINQSFNVDEYEKMLSVIFKKEVGDLSKPSERLAMSWQEIKEISKDSLCTIGAHTVHHFPLTQLTEDQLVFEINESKEKIEQQIKTPVDHFAYPFGKISEASIREFDAVKALKFKTGTTTRIGNIFKEHQSKMECLPRISINKITDNNVLHLQSSGLLSCIVNKGKKVITN